MTDRILLMVTQPAHGANGELLYQVGELFEPTAKLPNDVVTAKVIGTSEELAASREARAARLAPEPAAESEPEAATPAKPAAKAGLSKAAAGKT